MTIGKLMELLGEYSEDTPVKINVATPFDDSMIYKPTSVHYISPGNSDQPDFVEISGEME